MRRQTSAEIFRQITESGLLNKVNEEIYVVLYNNGPLTIKETCKLMSHRPETTISPRFADLERRGVIKALDKRPCRITGNQVISWDVTNNLPISFDKPKRHKCKTCNGKGYLEEIQSKWNL